MLSKETAAVLATLDQATQSLSAEAAGVLSSSIEAVASPEGLVSKASEALTVEATNVINSLGAATQEAVSGVNAPKVPLPSVSNFVRSALLSAGEALQQAAKSIPVEDAQ